MSPMEKAESGGGVSQRREYCDKRCFPQSHQAQPGKGGHKTALHACPCIPLLAKACIATILSQNPKEAKTHLKQGFTNLNGSHRDTALEPKARFEKRVGTWP